MSRKCIFNNKYEALTLGLPTKSIVNEVRNSNEKSSLSHPTMQF